MIFASDEKERLGWAAAESREYALSIELPDIAGRNQKNAAVSRWQEPGKAVDYASFYNRRVGALRGCNLKLGHPVNDNGRGLLRLLRLSVGWNGGTAASMSL